MDQHTDLLRLFDMILVDDAVSRSSDFGKFDSMLCSKKYDNKLPLFVMETENC